MLEIDAYKSWLQSLVLKDDFSDDRILPQLFAKFRTTQHVGCDHLVKSADGRSTVEFMLSCLNTLARFREARGITGHEPRR